MKVRRKKAFIKIKVQTFWFQKLEVTHQIVDLYDMLEVWRLLEVAGGQTGGYIHSCPPPLCKEKNKERAKERGEEREEGFEHPVSKFLDIFIICKSEFYIKINFNICF